MIVLHDWIIIFLYVNSVNFAEVTGTKTFVKSVSKTGIYDLWLFFKLFLLWATDSEKVSPPTGRIWLQNLRFYTRRHITLQEDFLSTRVNRRDRLRRTLFNLSHEHFVRRSSINQQRKKVLTKVRNELRRAKTSKTT